MTVARILEKKGIRVFTISEDATVRTAMQELAKHHIGALVVTDPAGGVSGILSERDIIREVGANEASLGKAVAEVMTRRVSTCTPDDTEGDIMERMGRAAVRHLPVLHHGKLIGLVSARDILNLRIEKLERLMDEIRSEAAKQA